MFHIYFFPKHAPTKIQISLHICKIKRDSSSKQNCLNWGLHGVLLATKDIFTVIAQTVMTVRAVVRPFRCLSQYEVIFQRFADKSKI